MDLAQCADAVCDLAQTGGHPYQEPYAADLLRVWQKAGDDVTWDKIVGRIAANNPNVDGLGEKLTQMGHLWHAWDAALRNGAMTRPGE